MEVRLRSKRLFLLFSEVLRKIPPNERDAIANRTLVITDNSQMLFGNQKPPWGSVVAVKYHKVIPIVYLRPRKLPLQSDPFIRYVIAYQLALIQCGHHEQQFLYDDLPDEVRERFGAEVNTRLRCWGIL